MSRLARAFLVLVLLGASAPAVDAATASWNANPEPNISGYILSYRAATPGVCAGGVPVTSATSLNVGNVTSVLIALTPGVQYFFVVRAANTSGLISTCSAEVAFTVSSGAPAFTTQPGSQAVVAGQTASFTAAATGAPAPALQWQVSTNSGVTWTNLANTAPYSGVSTGTLTVTGATTGLGGARYRAVASSSEGTTPSNAATLTVSSAVAPAMTTHPSNQTLTVGQNASFTVAASGAPAPTYQWQVSTNGGSTWSSLTNTAPYSGTTTVTLAVSSVTAALTGARYRAVATNAAGSATSNAATLTVNLSPSITAQPSNQTVTAGANASFTMAAGGIPTPSLQWQVSTNGGTSWTNLANAAPHSGVTTVTLAVTSTTTSLSGNQYRAVATNLLGSATSNAATLTVNAANVAPAITTQPSDQTVTAGQNASFIVAAGGTPAPTYQWQISTNGGTSWANLTNVAPYSGATTATLLLTNVTAVLAGAQYRAVATNSAGTSTSSAATLAVNVLPGFTTQPSNQIVMSGASTSFAVAANGSPAPTYQWQVSTNGGTSWTNLANGAPYSGVTTATLALSSVTTSLSGQQYRAVAANSVGSTTSNAATLTVSLAPVPPAITIQPTPQTVTAGQNGSFAVAATGIPAPTLEWQLSTNGGATWSNLTNVAPYSGVTTPTLALAAVIAGMTGSQYRAVATNTQGSALSGAATLTVNVAPAFTAQPSNQTVTGGQDASFTVAASGTPAPAYQWQASTDGGASWANLTNTSPYSGVTTTTLAVSGAAASLDGVRYRALAANVAGSATSNAATLTVNTTTAPSITTQPANQTVGAGQNVSFTAAATGTPAPSYQWQISTNGGASWSNLSNTAPYSGTTTTTLTLTNVTAGLNNARYRVSVANSAGSVVSNAATLTVDGPPAITAQPADQTVALGQPISFTVAASGTPAPAYQWQLSIESSTSWADIPGEFAKTSTLTLPAVTTWLNRTRFRCVVTNSAGTVVSNSALVKVHGKMRVSAERLSFSATKAGATLGTVTPAQSAVAVSFTGEGSPWTATANQPWLQIINGSGTDDGSFTVQIVNPGDVIGGNTVLQATILVTAGSVTSWPAAISVTLTVGSQTLAPALLIGSFDAPSSGTVNVEGAVALSGWAMAGSGVAIDRVEIWRDVVPGETAPPYTGPGPGRGKIFVATAPLIGGARPDIEAVFAGDAQAAHAGWGTRILTRGLSSLGDGRYTLHAIGYDTAGGNALLGTTTLVVDNAHATQPFGNIDAPNDGATVSGAITVAGWGLTPGSSCAIDAAGVRMTVDAGPLVPVAFGRLRPDVAAAFPGFINSDQAGGAVTLDTTTLSNGTHQLAWAVIDTCGREASIGSRFVNVHNAAAAFATTSSAPQAASAQVLSVNWDPIVIQTRTDASRLVSPNVSGTRVVQIEQGDHVRLQLPAVGGATYAGFQMVNGGSRALPVGSTFETETGRFAWEPGAGFLGSYEIVFVVTTADGASQAVRVRVIVGPSVRLQLDQPSTNLGAGQPFELTGWAVDLAAPDGAGIDVVQVWATPVDGGAPVRLGAATKGEARPDVAAKHGEQFVASGFRLLVNLAAPGTYDLSLSIETSASHALRSAQAVRITVR